MKRDRHNEVLQWVVLSSTYRIFSSYRESMATLIFYKIRSNILQEIFSVFSLPIFSQGNNKNSFSKYL